MNTEIEAKFLDVDHDAVRAKLTALGATCEQPMRLMRRLTLENPSMKAKGAFARVRDEGHRVVMTYKQFDDLSIDGAKEIEIVVDDFDKAMAFMKAIDDNWLKTSLQESRRETWQLGDVEIVLDEWPWLKPYIEIEGPSVEAVADTAGKLGFDMAHAVHGDVMSAYRAQYPSLGERDTVGNLPEVRFDDPLPEMMKLKDTL